MLHLSSTVEVEASHRGKPCHLQQGPRESPAAPMVHEVSFLCFNAFMNRVYWKVVRLWALRGCFEMFENV